MKNPRYYIGIDPDVEASGFAVWDGVKKSFFEISVQDLTDLCTAILTWHQSHVVKVRLEAGWMIKCTNYHFTGGKRAGNDVGRNHEVGRQIEKFCIKHSIPYELVTPQGYSSWNHNKFCAFTGWPKSERTNPDKRVAAMMVYGF